METEGKLVADLAVKANGQRIFTAPGEPPHVYYVLQPDGKLTLVQATFRERVCQATDLDTLCRLAVEHSKPDVGLTPEVWCCRSGVVAVLCPEEADRGPSCTLGLTASPQMACLTAWDRAGRVSLSQAELVLLLRTMFAGAVSPDFLPAVRNVRTAKNAEVNSQIAQGKVSLGKSIVAEMTGVAAIPERVTFLVPVFAESAVPIVGPVRVEIDPDPQSERFTLVVLPGDVERAYAAAEDNLVERVRRLLDASADTLAAGAVKVYRGKPGLAGA